MVWSNFKYSKHQLKKALKLLLSNTLGAHNTEVYEAYKLLANFRSSHAYPIQSMINYFRKKAFEVDKKAIIVRRLKRIPSILAKLKRNPTMKIDTMQDIGGVRIITKHLNGVYKITEKIKGGRTRNKLLREHDYIAHPKDSGYRSVHLVYAYQGEKEAYKNYRVELQIRSQIQHAWATAVEVVGTFNRENLKASQGAEAWLDFFKKASKALACLEHDQLQEYQNSAAQRELYKDFQALEVEKKLKAFSIVTESSGKVKGYYLLTLDLRESVVTVRHYADNFLQMGMDDYRRLEQDIQNDVNQDAVLVATDSITALKKAYPNYFADTSLFLEKLRRCLPMVSGLKDNL